jgi:hypothetical protein
MRQKVARKCMVYQTACKYLKNFNSKKKFQVVRKIIEMAHFLKAFIENEKIIYIFNLRFFKIDLNIYI